MTKNNATYDFGDYKNDKLVRPRDLCWANWKKFEEVGDMVQGFVRDVFYRPAEAQFSEQRGITIEQTNGELINIGIKRLSFVLAATDKLRVGDPITAELVELKKSATKGFSPTKIFAYYGKNLPENVGPTVKELEAEDMAAGGTVTPVETKEDIMPESNNIDENGNPKL